MWPKEHGAYGQLLFPLGTVLAVGRPTAPALLLASAAIGAFLAHEPLLVLLGHRGSRAAREQRARAAIWFGVFAGAAAVCGLAAIALAPAGARLALTVSAALAGVLAFVILAQRERTTYGEGLTAVTLASLAYPVGLAAHASSMAATTCAGVFCAVFVSGTLGVRSVIAHARRPPATGARARATIVAVVSAALLWWIARSGIGDSSAPWAALPVCALAVVLAVAPPSAKRLRVVGWSLVVATTVTAAILVTMLR